ncbi:MAG: Fur family transcriptional regulator, partial [Flavobacteriales bacterium]
MDEKNKLAALLRERKLKATPTRLAVLELFLENDNAVAHSVMQEQLEDFDRVTLYRILQALLEHGVIHKAFTRDNETYYALCSHTCSSQQHQHEHIHFKCTKCEEVSCVQIEQPIQLQIPG